LILFCPQLWKQLRVKVEGFGVCESIPIGYGSVVYNVRDRNLNFLHVESVWNIRHFQDQSWNVLRRSLSPNHFPDFLFQFLSKLVVRGQFDEEDDSLISRPVLSYRETVGDLRQFLNHIVDFRRADTDPRGLYRRVRTSIERVATSIAVDQHIVTMPPNVLPFGAVVFEVGLTVPLIVGVIPEVYRHGWSWRLAA